MADEAIVVGAGAIGVAAAYFLGRDGWRVRLVDRGEPGRGCSYGNACLVVPSHSEPLPAPGVLGQAVRWMLRRESPFYVRPRLDPELAAWAWRFRRSCTQEAFEHGHRALLALSRRSRALYDELVDAEGIAFFFERRGLLHVYLEPAALEEADRERAALAAAGFASTLLGPEEARRLEPAVSPDIAGALFVEGDAHGDCYAYVRALAAAVERQGGRILAGRAVRRLLADGPRVRGVELEPDGERLEADLVVLAAGSWSARLARPLGLRIPLQPAKGYSATIRVDDGAPRIPLLVHGRRVIVTPLDGRLRFGGTLELAGFDESIDPVRYGAVRRTGAGVLAAPPATTDEERWCGLRPLTPDGLPIVDRPAGLDGLVVATGHAMLGFTQSPATGRAVADLAAGRAPSVPLDAFRLDRFDRA